MRWVYLVLLLVIVTIIVVFVVQNDEKQTGTFFNQRFTAPLSVYFVVVYFLGMWSGGTVVGFFKRATADGSSNSPAAGSGRRVRP